MSYNQKPPGPGAGGMGGGPPNGPNSTQNVAKTLAGIQQQMQSLVHGQNALPQTQQADLNAFLQQQRFQTMFKQQQQQFLQQHFQQQMQHQQQQQHHNKDRGGGSGGGGGEPLALTRTPAADLLNKSYQQQQANGSTTATNPALNQFQQQLQALPPNIMQQLQAFQYQMQAHQQQQQQHHTQSQQPHHTHPQQQPQPQAGLPLPPHASQQQLHGQPSHQQQHQQKALQAVQQLQSLQQRYLSAVQSAVPPVPPPSNSKVGLNTSTPTPPPPPLTNQMKPPSLPPSTQITPVPASNAVAAVNSSHGPPIPPPNSVANASVTAAIIAAAAAKQVPTPSISLLPAKQPVPSTSPTPAAAHQQMKFNTSKPAPVVSAIPPPFPTPHFQKPATAAAPPISPSTKGNTSPAAAALSTTISPTSGTIVTPVVAPHCAASKSPQMQQSNPIQNTPLEKPPIASSTPVNATATTAPLAVPTPLVSNTSITQNTNEKSQTHPQKDTTLNKNINIDIQNSTSNGNNVNETIEDEAVKNEEIKAPQENDNTELISLAPEPQPPVNAEKDDAESSKDDEKVKSPEESISTSETSFDQEDQAQTQPPQDQKEPIVSASKGEELEKDIPKPEVIKAQIEEKPAIKTVVPESPKPSDLKSEDASDLTSKLESKNHVTIEKTVPEAVEESKKVEKRNSTIEQPKEKDKSTAIVTNALTEPDTDLANQQSKTKLENTEKILEVKKQSVTDKVEPPLNLEATVVLEKDKKEIKSTDKSIDKPKESKKKIETKDEIKTSTKPSLTISEPIENIAPIPTSIKPKVNANIEAAKPHSTESTPVRKPSRQQKSSRTEKDAEKSDKPASNSNINTSSRNTQKRKSKAIESPIASNSGVVASPATPMTPSESASDRKSKRHRLKTILYQSPLPELAFITKLSASEASNSPKPMLSAEDRLIVFYKNEYMAVRNAEGTFYLCQTMQNVYKTSPRISIRWLSEDPKDNSVYIPDFYDHTDIECVLTTVDLKRIDKGHLRLPKTEKSRIESILKKAIDVEKGLVPRPELSEENPDGLDISLYKDESQIEKKSALTGSIVGTPSTAGRKSRRSLNSEAELLTPTTSTAKSASLTSEKKRKRSTIASSSAKLSGESFAKKQKSVIKRKKLSKGKKGATSDEDNDAASSDSEYKPNKKKATNVPTTSSKSSPRAQRSPLAKARAASPIMSSTSRAKNVPQKIAPSPTTSSRGERATKRKSTAVETDGPSVGKRMDTSHMSTKSLNIKIKAQTTANEISYIATPVRKIVSESNSSSSPVTNTETGSNSSFSGGSSRPTRSRK